MVQRLGIAIVGGRDPLLQLLRIIIVGIKAIGPAIRDQRQQRIGLRPDPVLIDPDRPIAAPAIEILVLAPDLRADFGRDARLGGLRGIGLRGRDGRQRCSDQQAGDQGSAERRGAARSPRPNRGVDQPRSPARGGGGGGGGGQGGPWTA